MEKNKGIERLSDDFLDQVVGGPLFETNAERTTNAGSMLEER